MAEKAKYIDVKELSIILDTMKNPDSEFATDDYINGFSNGISAAIKELEAFPTADVAPVRHGHWIKTSLMFASSNGKHGNVHVCSNCGEQSGVGFKTSYCAICGAKMDGKENNDNE